MPNASRNAAPPCPRGRRLFGLPGLGRMVRHHLPLTFRYLNELALESIRDTGMEHTARLAQQRAVGGVLY